MELKYLDLRLILLLGVRSKHYGTGYSGKIFGLQTQFIRQISEFLPGFCSKEEEEILDLLKQLADYDISAQTLRKIEQK